MSFPTSRTARWRSFGVTSVGRAISRTLLACAICGSVVAAAQGQTGSDTVPETPTWALTGTLLQLMRGIFFPAANMIFNVQAHNPGQKKLPPKVSSGGAGFDWVKWGASLYSGWDDVDYAAVSLAEVTPLLLTPGRLCQNGKPVPVERPDWVKYTIGMLQAARKTYEAARARNQGAVSDSTNELSDACLACHRVYRDRRPAGAGPADPASMALRCTAP
jgi:hypothetical protein